MFKLETIEQWC